MYEATFCGVLRYCISYRHVHTKHSSLWRLWVSPKEVGGFKALGEKFSFFLVLVIWWYNRRNFVPKTGRGVYHVVIGISAFGPNQRVVYQGGCLVWKGRYIKNSIHCKCAMSGHLKKSNGFWWFVRIWRVWNVQISQNQYFTKSGTIWLTFWVWTHFHV